jgi:uncharacterized protein YraI
MRLFHKKIVRGVLCLLLLLMGITLSQAQGSAKVRFVHVIPGASAVDIYINGALAITQLNYGSATSYLTVPAGTHTLTVTPAGLPSLLWEQPVSVEANQSVALVASSASNLSFIPFAEQLSSLELGTGRLQLIHAIAGAPNVDIQVAVDTTVGGVTAEAGTPVAPGLAYGAKAELDLPAQTYLFNVVAEGTAVLADWKVPLASNTSVIALLYGTPSAPQTLYITTAAAPAANTGLVRFVHGVVGAPAVDVVVNDAVVIPSLTVDRPSEHIALPSGEHELVIRAEGTDETLAEGQLVVTAGAAQTIVAVQGAVGVDLLAFEDAVSGVTAANAVASIINTIPGTSGVDVFLSDDTPLASNVEFGEASPPANIPPTRSALKFTLVRGDVSGTVDVAEQTFDGGVYYNIIVLDGGAFAAPRLLFVPTALAQGLASAPGAGQVTIATNINPNVAQPTTAPETIATQPAAVQATPVPPTSAPILPPATSVPLVITGRVTLDPGANLQLREYPSSDAKSLGLAPSGTILIVNGREGAPVALIEGQDPPPEAADWVDPVTLLGEEEDLEAAETWLNVTYATPDGGTIVAWVNALYVDVRNNRDLRVKLRDLELVGGNVPGGAEATAITPPPVPQDRINGTVVGLASGANLNIRRTPETSGEVLARLTEDTVVQVFGFLDTNEWTFIEYRPASGGVVTGWVSTQYLTYSFNNRAVSVEDLQTTISSITGSPLYIEITSDRRGNISGSVAESSVAANPLRDAYIAEAVIDPGANLHLRRNPDAASESLNLVPSGSRLIVDARNETGDWLRVTFEGETGWVSALYVKITFNGNPVEIDDIPVDTGLGVETDPALPTAVPTAVPTAGS